ncbi:hypothetical protein ERJ75_000177200 [Trypanosoma vivax]|nr:hypothetical protein ERJ75_000177200 [Trypanosoma vivax]
MAFRFNLALLAAILLNGAVLGDDSTCSGALAGAGGERNAPSFGGDAGCKSEGRARNGDKLVVLDSARTTPSETVRKSVSVMRRMSSQSSLSNRNEVRSDHVAVGSELHDQPATSHKAQARAGDKHGMKLPHARRPVASRHSEGGLTTTSPKESGGVVDRKKEFENMVNGIIAEERDNSYEESHPSGFPEGKPYEDPYYTSQNTYGTSGGNGGSGAEVLSGDSSSVNNTLTTESVSGSVTSVTSNSDSGQGSATGNKDRDNTNDSKAPKYVQKDKKDDEDEKEKGEKQLDEQRSNENSDERETNNSSEDTENNEAPPSENSALLCGSYSSVLLVALVCLCACAC